MAYLGRQPIIGNYQVLDALTASATATYALTKGGVAVFPQTPANCIVSLNGVIQAPFDSYTISGSNIVFASALTGSDSIDFITVLGDVLNVGTVSDGTIGLAKLSATGTKDATTFLRGDNTFATAGGTNTPAFFARLSANQSVTNNASSKAQCNTEILDTDSCYDNVTNYRFTPTTAGKYFVFGQIGFNTGLNNSVQLAIVGIKKNGSTIQYNQFDFRTNYAGPQNMVMSHGIVDMDGTTDYLELFGEIYSVTGSTFEFGGSASNNSTSFGAYKIIE
jgi:hypothetical protein